MGPPMLDIDLGRGRFADLRQQQIARRHQTLHTMARTAAGSASPSIVDQAAAALVAENRRRREALDVMRAADDEFNH